MFRSLFLSTHRNLLRSTPRSISASAINSIDVMRGVIADEENPGRVVLRDNIPRPMETPGYARMRVLAAGLNRADLLQAAGKYPAPAGITPVLGLECAGILPNGSYACGLVSGGALAEEVLIPLGNILQVSNLPETSMAAIPEAFLVAYHLLFQLADLKPNSTLVLNAAGSGIGTAVVQLARTVPGVKIIASARGEKKRQHLSANLGPDGIVVDPTASPRELSSIVIKCTDGKGADVLLDCVGADSFRENARALRVDGKWILYGLLSGAKSKDINLAALLSRRIHLISTTIRSRNNEFKGKLVSEFENAGFVDMLSHGTLKPIVDKVFNGLDKTQEGLEYMKKNENVGKIVIRVSDPS